MSDTATSQVVETAVQSPVTEPMVSHGSIKNVVAFKNSLNNEVRRLCSVSRKWATTETTAIMLFIFDEYVAQLDSLDQFDSDDLRPYVANWANMNAAYNRYSEAKMIDRNEKGKGKSVVRDLI